MDIQMINTVYATFRKNRNTARRAYPWSFITSRLTGGFFALLFPVFIYYLVFQGHLSTDFIFYTHSSDYITYVVIGEALNIMSFSIMMNVGRSLISEIREGTIDNILISPASRMGYFLGCYLEQFVRSIMELVVIFLFGFILGAKIYFSQLAKLIFLIILSSLAFFAVSILLSSIMVFTRDTYISQNTLFTIMTLLCGVSFPIQYFPNGIRWLSSIFPLTPAIALFRNCLLNDQALESNWNLIFQIIILSFIYLIMGRLWLKKLEKRLIEEVFA